MRWIIAAIILLPAAFAYTPSFLERPDAEICVDATGKPIMRMYYTAMCGGCVRLAEEVYRPIILEYQSKGLATGMEWMNDWDGRWQEKIRGGFYDTLPPEEREWYLLDNPNGQMKFEFGCRFWRLGGRRQTGDWQQQESEEFRDVIEEVLRILNACSSNADCTDGICCNEECVEPGCRTDSDCGADQCKIGICTNPGTCDAQCTEDWDACRHNDLCCPPGCYKEIDNDCAAECLEDSHCPGGVCCDNECRAPECISSADCTADDACSVGLCVGTGCDAVCEYTVPGICAHSDGCCPDGCYKAIDNDCSAVCLEDTHCPAGVCCQNQCMAPVCAVNADCNDDDACTQDICLNPGRCDAACQNSVVLRCGMSDGCCPAGCVSATDPDCNVSCYTDAECGRGSACCAAVCVRPACGRDLDCDDQDSCTADVCQNPSKCNATCVNTNTCAPGTAPENGTAGRTREEEPAGTIVPRTRETSQTPIEPEASARPRTSGAAEIAGRQAASRAYTPATREDIAAEIVEGSVTDDTLYYALSGIIVMAGAGYIYYRRLK